MSQKPSAEVPRHQLALDDTRPFANWAEWKKTFERVNILEARESFLHFGFQVPTPNVGERRDRILFYLDLSMYAFATAGLYGHSNPFGRNGSVVVESFGVERGSLSEARQRVARKACEVLCQQFLKKKTDMDPVYDRSVSMAVRQVLNDEAMLRSTLKLLKTSWAGVRRPFLANFGHTAPKHVVEIISFFVETFWDASFWPRMLSENPFTDEDKALGERALALRPAIALILVALDKPLLITNRYTELDDATIDALEKAALRSRGTNSSPPHNRTTFSTIEEAAGNGSSLARAMILIRVLRKEHQRQEAIKLAEKQLKASTQRIAELTKHS